MALESIQKVRAEARGHMKTSMFSGPDACAQIKVSEFNELRRSRGTRSLRKLAELHSCIHVAPGFSPVSKLTATADSAKIAQAAGCHRSRHRRCGLKPAAT